MWSRFCELVSRCSDGIYLCFFFFFANSLQIVKEKDRFRKAPPNYAMKKTQLLKDKVKSRKDLIKKIEKTSSISNTCLYLKIDATMVYVL